MGLREEDGPRGPSVYPMRCLEEGAFGPESGSGGEILAQRVLERAVTALLWLYGHGRELIGYKDVLVFIEDGITIHRLRVARRQGEDYRPWLQGP